MERLYCCVTPVETVDILEDAFEEGKLYAIGGPSGKTTTLTMPVADRNLGYFRSWLRRASVLSR